MWTRACLAGVLYVLVSTVSFAAEHGAWHNDAAHGYQRYWTENRAGSRFTIWCPENRNLRGTLIGIDIKGHLPSPDSLVLIELDHKLIKFNTGSDGYIRTDCPACADNLTYFWHRLRSSVKFAIQLEDRRYAGFSLRGVQETMPATVCSSQFARTPQ